MLVGAERGERVADLCAAPGGKSAAMAEAIGTGGGRVFASDRSHAGVRRVAAEARRGAGRPISAVVADGTTPPFAARSFDAVLLDAPCSGLGTLRAHPEIRWRRTPERVADLARLQRKLIEAAGELVRPGGRLVYATCTLLREENEDVVDGFLSRRPDFRREDARGYLPGATSLVDDRGALHTSPDRGGLDGFYAVRLRAADG
jgi:16S rRNA (cytosine967-C5)-methyltransferase